MAKILRFTSNRHGRFYSSFVVLQDGQEPIIAIAGPYNTEVRAEKHGKEWARLNVKLLKAGKPLQLPDTASVPHDVRNYIATSLVDALRQHGLEALQGKAFGRSSSGSRT